MPGSVRLSVLYFTTLPVPVNANQRRFLGPVRSVAFLKWPVAMHVWHACAERSYAGLLKWPMRVRRGSKRCSRAVRGGITMLYLALVEVCMQCEVYGWCAGRGVFACNEVMRAQKLWQLDHVASRSGPQLSS